MSTEQTQSEKVVLFIARTTLLTAYLLSALGWLMSIGMGILAGLSDKISMNDGTGYLFAVSGLAFIGFTLLWAKSQEDEKSK